MARGGFKWREKQVKIKTAGWLHLFLQLGLGQQLWNKVQADMDGGDPCYSQRQQSWIVTLPRERSQQKPAHVLETNHDSDSPTTSFQLCCLEGTWNQPSARLTTPWQRNSGSCTCCDATIWKTSSDTQTDKLSFSILCRCQATQSFNSFLWETI